MNKHSNNITYTEREKKIRKHWLISLFISIGVSFISFVSSLLFYLQHPSIPNFKFFIIYYISLYVLAMTISPYLNYRFAYKKNGTAWLMFIMISSAFILFTSYFFPSIYNYHGPVFKHNFLFKIISFLSSSYFLINCFLLYKINRSRKRGPSQRKKSIFKILAITTGSLLTLIIFFVILGFSTIVFFILKNPDMTKIMNSIKLKTNGSVLIETSSKNIKVNGSGEIKKISIPAKLTVHGSFSITESTIEEMIAFGEIYLNKTTIKKKSFIYGPLNVRNSILDKIIISSKKVMISDSITKTIIVKKIKAPIKQVIELHNTKINGDILFEGGNGEVLLNKNSKITGKIIGGILVNKTT